MRAVKVIWGVVKVIAFLGLCRYVHEMDMDRYKTFLSLVDLQNRLGSMETKIDKLLVVTQEILNMLTPNVRMGTHRHGR